MTNETTKATNLKGATNNAPKKKGISLKEHLEFPGTLKTNITTSQSLAELINGVLRNVLSDYEGCFIGVDQNGLNLTLYFTDKGEATEGQIKVLKNMTKTPVKSAPVIEKIHALSMYSRSNMFTLTDDAKEVISGIMDVPGNAKINWSNCVTEVTVPVNNYGQAYNVTVKVSGVSINKILQIVYGTKDEDGKYVQYSTSILRPVPYSPSIFIISIMQLRTEQLEQLAQSTGLLGQTFSNVQMVKAY